MGRHLFICTYVSLSMLARESESESESESKSERKRDYWNDTQV